VIEGDPLRKVAHVFPNPLELGVEQVCTVLGTADAVRIDIVVAVAANVIPLIDDQRSHAQLLAATLGQHGTREPSSHDEQVGRLRRRADISRQNCILQLQRSLRDVTGLENCILANDVLHFVERSPFRFCSANTDTGRKRAKWHEDAL